MLSVAQVGYITGTTAGGPVRRTKVWNGSTWVVGTLKVWNGSSWQAGLLKVWNGSSWI